METRFVTRIEEEAEVGEGTGVAIKGQHEGVPVTETFPVLMAAVSIPCS